MEPILDAGKAVVCVNVVRQDNPCFNLYCQNCCINFLMEKYNFNYQGAAGEQNQDSAAQEQKQKPQ